MSPVYLDSMGHLVADDRDELHAFAARIGMKRAWFQDQPRHPHYDLMTTGKRQAAIRAGAIRITPREAVGVLRRAASDGHQ